MEIIKRLMKTLIIGVLIIYGLCKIFIFSSYLKERCDCEKKDIQKKISLHFRDKFKDANGTQYRRFYFVECFKNNASSTIEIVKKFNSAIGESDTLLYVGFLKRIDNLSEDEDTTDWEKVENNDQIIYFDLGEPNEKLIEKICVPNHQIDTLKMVLQNEEYNKITYSSNIKFEDFKVEILSDFFETCQKKSQKLQKERVFNLNIIKENKVENRIMLIYLPNQIYGVLSLDSPVRLNVSE